MNPTKFQPALKRFKPLLIAGALALFALPLTSNAMLDFYRDIESGFIEFAQSVRIAGNTVVTGNLGVGTASPWYRLDVRTANPWTEWAHIAYPTGNFVDIRPNMLIGNNNPIVRTGDAGIIFSSGSVGWGAFVIAPWSTASSGMRMDASGDVGIGTSAPNSRLHVYRDSGNNAEIDIQSVAGSDRQWALYADRSSNSFRIWNNDILWEKNSVTILNNGNVGIGTTSPGEMLEVAGNIRLSGSSPTNRLTNLGAPVSNSDATNKSYVDAVVAAAGGASSSQYLNNGEYYSVGGDPFYCKMFKLGDGKQSIKAINYRKSCDLGGGKFCNKDAACSSTLDPLILASGPWLHKCVLYGNGALCWGRGADGQLGNGTTTDKLTPTAVTSLDSPTAVFNGMYSSCAIVKDLGKVKCWGFMKDAMGATPVTVGNVYNAKEVAINYNRSFLDSNNRSDNSGYPDMYSSACILSTDGTIKCWGYNASGQLGNNTTTAASYTAPVSVLNPDGSTLTGATNVYLSSYAYSNSYGWSTFPYGCALLSDGRAKCWGANESGQLGDGTQTQRTTATVVKNTDGTELTNVKSLRLFGTSTCAVLNDGKLKCWGSNNNGQVGNGGWTSVSTDKYTGSSQTSCWLRGGSLYCWGGGSVGYFPNVTVPYKYMDSSVARGNNSMTALAQGYGFLCTLKNGSAYCQGYNANGQLGNGTMTSTYYYTTDGLAPVSTGALAGGNTNVSQITAGQYHACALQNGIAYCWGYNDNGQLGDGTQTARLVPVKVADGVIPGGNAGISSIAAGSVSTCAIKNGSAYCWGQNGNGSLGDGTSTDRYSPVAVSTGALVGGNTNIAQITVGQDFTCALQNGIAYCWGQNGNGSLGDGSNTNRATPVRVSTGSITGGTRAFPR